MRPRIIGSGFSFAVGIGVISAFSPSWRPVLAILMAAGLIGGIAVNIASFPWRMAFVGPAASFLGEAGERAVPASAFNGPGDYVWIVVGAMSWMLAVGLLARPTVQSDRVAEETRPS